MMYTRTVEITPEVAKEMLEKNVYNRRYRAQHAKDIANDIKSGRWVDNGDTIAFDINGRLIDGQHRLSAIVMAGATITMIVVYGLPENAFAFKDTNRRLRRGADALELVGEKYGRGLAATLSAIERYFDGKLLAQRTAAYPNDIILKLRDKYPGASASYAKLHSLYSKTRLMQPSYGAALHYLFSSVDNGEADRFFDDLFIGANLQPTDPVFRLRNRLIEGRSSKSSMPPHYVAALCIKAWNHRRAGTQLKTLRVRDDEQRPQIDGIPKRIERVSA